MKRRLITPTFKTPVFVSLLTQAKHDRYAQVMQRIPVLQLLALVVLAFVLSGCAGIPIDAANIAADRGRYNDNLAADRKDAVAASADLKRYGKIVIDPIVISYSDGSDFKNISPGRLEKLAGSFRDVAIEAFGDAYTVVHESGPDVLRLKLAVTELDVKKNRVLPTPFGLIRLGIEHAIEHHYTLKDAVLRVEILDSQTSDRLVERADRLSLSTEGKSRLSREEIESRIAYHVSALL